ncbi:AbgT family transporter [Entomospira culicis]|uniref:AbgT family transporter n=1 Tax=Entomospira culicis TaxID=2719989 RepID=A0A968GGG8_9SPIO|nr:AbgT family transporter [Entomospira culicis]NIZ19653.1 AbgT family transporter [Entomospira culicis]NIZ69867.1 AbgT family transporter [Entomospira culicis]WDI36973.1 AbgT family transporter [Entomospira culicis]WDI38602.1 AbgT family transporter [Entomospira culicis]
MSTERKKGFVERIGELLPESNLLFLILISFIIVASFFAKGSHPSAMEGAPNYTVQNLLSVEGFRWILSNVLDNFRKYPPLALVVVGVLGFGFAEKSGLLGTLIKIVGHNTSEKMILPVIILIGINSSIASDAGYIVLIPLSGALYAGLGKNPLIGIVASFAAVSAGFGAAMIPSTADGLLGKITQDVYESAFGGDFPHDPVMMNYIFMFGSTIFLTIFLTFITKMFVEKRVESYDYTLPENTMTIGELHPEEKEALKKAGIAVAITLLGIVLLWVVGVLKSYPDGKGGMTSPILNNIIVLLIALFLFPGLAYARSLKKINNGQEYIKMTVDAMRDIAYILVFAVFAGNFLAIFSHSGLDKYIANHGAFFLINQNIQNPIFLIVSFIFISAFINFFMGSASAKWAILAPIFIPMLMIASDNQLGPDVIQVAYRIGDSSTNIISPLMTYMGIVLIAARHYVPKFEIGNLISLMLPYSLSILLGWTAFFVLWLLLKLPIGWG